jgi:branched-chain amino acid transport system substrate-binding protein
LATADSDEGRGYLTWLDWLNSERGGIDLGGEELLQIELIFIDEESSTLYPPPGNPQGASDAAEEMIVVKDVDFLMGPSGDYANSGLTEAAAKVADFYDVVIITPSSDAEAVFDHGYGNLFGVLTPAGLYAESILEMLAERGAETVVIAYAETDVAHQHFSGGFHTAVGEGAAESAFLIGLDVLAIESYPAGTADVSDIVSRFRDLDPDVFIGSGHNEDPLMFALAAADLGFSPDAMVFSDSFGAWQVKNEFGHQARTVIDLEQWSDEVKWRGQWIGNTAEFNTRYEDMWGDNPSYQAAGAAAASLALTIAIEAAGSLDTEAVRNALLDLDVVTFYGPIDFDEKGRNIAKPMSAFQYQGGEPGSDMTTRFLVGPAEATWNELVYPAPAWGER